MSMARKRKKKAVLLGVGLDNKDEHKRLTRGDNFLLVGGSEPTHARMTEGAIKLNEHLKKRGKTLDDVERSEFVELAHKAGLLERPELN